jgi:hypothetical protein
MFLGYPGFGSINQDENTPYYTGRMNMKSVDMLAFGVALALGLTVAQTPREMSIALGLASATLLAKLLITGPSSNAR